MTLWVSPSAVSAGAPSHGIPLRGARSPPPGLRGISPAAVLSGRKHPSSFFASCRTPRVRKVAEEPFHVWEWDRECITSIFKSCKFSYWRKAGHWARLPSLLEPPAGAQGPFPRWVSRPFPGTLSTPPPAGPEAGECRRAFGGANGVPFCSHLRRLSGFE